MTAPIFQNLLPCRACDATLSDFMRLPVIRKNGYAEIIVAYYLEGSAKVPIRLIGFMTDSDNSDYVIREQGFEYLQALNKEVK